MMIRLAFRLLSLASLLAAAFFGILDLARSLAASRVVVTPLGVDWTAMSPETLEWVRVSTTQLAAGVLWDPVLTGLLAQPTFIAFLVLAILLFAVGSPPAHRQVSA